MLLRCYFRHCTGVLWCWYRGCRLVLVWILVLGEVLDLNIALPFNDIANNEPTGLKFLKARIHINVIGWEHLHFDALGSVFHPSLTISQGPEADEKQTLVERKLDKILVFKKLRFDVSGSRHYIDPLSCNA